MTYNFVTSLSPSSLFLIRRFAYLLETFSPKKFLQTFFEKTSSHKIQNDERKLIAECAFDLVRWRMLLDFQIFFNDMKSKDHTFSLFHCSFTLSNISTCSCLKNFSVSSFPSSFSLNSSLPLCVLFHSFISSLSPSNIWPLRFDVYIQNEWRHLSENPCLCPHIRNSIPKFLFGNLLLQLGENKAKKVCEIQNQKPHLFIRVNKLKSDVSSVLEIFKNTNIVPKKSKYTTYGINIQQQTLPSSLTPLYLDGVIEIQDEATQIIADQVKCKYGDKVLDYCAGAGGKSLAVAHRLQCNKSTSTLNRNTKHDFGESLLVLHDIRNGALRRAYQRLVRAGVSNFECISNLKLKRNAHKFQSFFDWIICDVPCSNTGTLRSHPECKWMHDDYIEPNVFDLLNKTNFNSNKNLNEVNSNTSYPYNNVIQDENDFKALKYKTTFSEQDFLTPKSLQTLIQLQRKIVKETLKFLKRNGIIVYSTCSILRQENEEQVDYFEKEFGLICVNKKKINSEEKFKVNVEEKLKCKCNTEEQINHKGEKYFKELNKKMQTINHVMKEDSNEYNDENFYDSLTNKTKEDLTSKLYAETYYPVSKGRQSMFCALLKLKL